jgi:hypothetical protein
MFWKTGSVAKPDLYRVELNQDTPFIGVMKDIRMRMHQVYKLFRSTYYTDKKEKKILLIS